MQTKNYNVIFEDEDIIGRLSNIIEVLEDGIKEDPEDELLKETLEQAKKLYQDNDEDYIYRCWYHAMGAYFFEKLVPETK